MYQLRMALDAKLHPNHLTAPAPWPPLSSDTAKAPSASPCAPPIPLDSSRGHCTMSISRPCGNSSVVSLAIIPTSPDVN